MYSCGLLAATVCGCQKSEVVVCLLLDEIVVACMMSEVVMSILRDGNTCHL